MWNSKYNKGFVKSWDWTLRKAAYVPLSRIKSDVVQLERFEQEIELPGGVRLVRAFVIETGVSRITPRVSMCGTLSKRIVRSFRERQEPADKMKVEREAAGRSRSYLASLPPEF